MICVEVTAFCDLRIRLATLRKSERKFWFCKLALTCESVWPGLKEQDELFNCFCLTSITSFKTWNSLRKFNTRKISFRVKIS